MLLSLLWPFLLSPCSFTTLVWVVCFLLWACISHRVVPFRSVWFGNPIGAVVIRFAFASNGLGSLASSSALPLLLLVWVPLLAPLLYLCFHWSGFPC